jgi:predicted GNAT family acetyltransferase
MKISSTQDSIAFSQKHTATWLANEASDGVVMRTALANRSGLIYYSVIESGQTMLTACLVPGDQILLSDGSEQAARELAKHFVDEQIDIPGLFAPHPVAVSFAIHYSELKNQSYKTVKQLSHYELDKLGSMNDPEGRFEGANIEDKETLIRFKDLSQQEENTQRPYDSSEVVELELSSKTIFVWKSPNDEILSIGSAYCDRSKRTGYINGIYTPKKMRKKGYATAITYHLAKLISEKGLIPSLAVDVVNYPAINVYEKLGFVKKCQMDNIRFSK